MFPSKVSSECRGSQAHYARFLLKSFLAIVFAFPLGIITALIEAVSLFGSILPISILFGLIFPIIVPLIAISGVLLGSWHLGKKIAATVKKVTSRSHTVHILLHAHEIAYMGIYGMLVMAMVPKITKIPPFSPIRRQTHSHLFIHDFRAISAIPVFPPTPPYSDSSYTPSRSPTFTESTDMSFPLHTPPADELPRTSLAQLSALLDTLKDDELNIVASYVEILRRGRSSSSVECSVPRSTNFPQY